MSYYLRQLEGAERHAECMRQEAAMGIAQTTATRTYPFLVLIGKRGAPRLQFGVLAADWWDAFNKHVCLTEAGERCEVRPVGVA
jgi:hypothetical protein